MQLLDKGACEHAQLLGLKDFQGQRSAGTEDFGLHEAIERLLSDLSYAVRDVGHLGVDCDRGCFGNAGHDVSLLSFAGGGVCASCGCAGEAFVSDGAA